ncbi:MAG: DnaB-like helicase C-terminal domain-containing protein, partial [Bryobacteraceae bacterium]
MADFDKETRIASREGVSLRTPPHSIEAEESLLACCLIDSGDTLTLARTSGVTAESFYEPAHRVVFESLCSMELSARPIDEIVLVEELRKKNMLDAVGGLVRLNQITNRTPTSAHRSYFLEQIKTLHGLREIIKASTSAIEKAYQFQGAPADLVTELNNVSSSLLSIKEPESYEKSVDQAIEVAKARIEGRESASDGKFITGLPTFDRIAGRAGRGEMVVVGALPSLGKSALIGQGTLATIRNGHHVAIFNRETGTTDYLMRMAALTSGANPRGLRRELPERQQRFIEELTKLKSLDNLHIFRRESDFGSICARARQLACSVKLEAVIIDHIGLVLPPAMGRGANREREVAAMSNGFKNLAIDLDIPVFVICQLNRLAERDNRPPRRSDLKDSSALEQDADRIWFLHREDVDANGHPQVDRPDQPPINILHEILIAA